VLSARDLCPQRSEGSRKQPLPSVRLPQSDTRSLKVRNGIDPLALMLRQVGREERMSGVWVRLQQVEPMREWERILTSHPARSTGCVRPDSSGDVGYEERTPDAKEVKEVDRFTALTQNETHQGDAREDGDRLDEVSENEVSCDRAPHRGGEAVGRKPSDEAYSDEQCVLEQSAHGRRCALASRFLRTFRPLPETARDLGRQTIPQLARQHDDLAPMMAFVRNEIRKDVSNIERKIAPGIRRAGGDGAAVITPQRQEADHPPAAPVERLYELLRADATPIDRFRHFDPVLLAQRFDPHAARVVNVASDHPNCPARGTGHLCRPEFWGQMLDQEDSGSIGRPPHWNERICQVESRRHHQASVFTMRV
jgi:hypothetical protein